MQFFAPGGDEGGGSGEGEGSTLLEALHLEDEGAPEPKIDDPTPEPKPSLVDASELAKQFGDVLGKQFAKVQPEKQTKPPLSADEAKKLLRHFDIDDDLLKRMNDLPTQKAAMSEFKEKLVLHNDAIAQARMAQMQEAYDNKFKELEERFSPMQSMIETQMVQQREERFNSSYPQLANPELRPLLGAVAQRLYTAGSLSSDESKNFELIAKGVESVIKATNSSFKLEAKASLQKKSNPNAIRATTPGTGGGGGSTAAVDESKGRPKLMSLLPKIS